MFDTNLFGEMDPTHQITLGRLCQQRDNLGSEGDDVRGASRTGAQGIRFDNMFPTGTALI